MGTSRHKKSASSRRDFLKRTAEAVVGGTVAFRVGFVPAVYPAGSDLIRVGLIGCGARGTGAADDAINAGSNIKLVAMGDVFEEHLESSRELLKRKLGGKVDVPEDRCFVGLDAYEKVIASGVDYVILATPPGFRPLHLKAAVAAGMHVFTEKPVAVDAPGIRTCLEVYEQAKARGLGIVAGTQRRHTTGYLETIKRIHDGAIGQILAARAYWNQGPVWVHPRLASWSDLEWQLRNWYYFAWLCGDHIVEQHVHNLDIINWAIGAHPIRAVGVGGRQVRTGAEYGHIYDHFTVDYEYEDGCHLTSMCRQMPNCENDVAEALIGTRGTCQVNRYSITGATSWRFQRADNKDEATYAQDPSEIDKSWRFQGPSNKPYVQEHAHLIESIRAGKPVNELKTVAESTMTGIMGRMAAYTGKVVTWDQALNSQENLMPPKLDWNTPLPVPPVPMPGQTELR